MKGNTSWRLIYNPEGNPVDVVAYPSALAEGRIAGKYMLSKQELPDTLVVQGFNAKGIVAGADVKIDRELAASKGIELIKMPRSGRGGPQPVGTIDYSDLIKNASKKFDAQDPDPEEPAVILYTSGTTGKPKGVTLTHKNFISQGEMVDKVMPMESSDIFVIVLPLYHVYALSNGLFCGLKYGSGLSLIPQYSPEKLLNNIAEVKATILIAIPNMYMHILQLARSRDTKIPKSLRLCVSGGAPLPLKTINEFMEVFQTEIAEGYGLTETTSAVSLNKPGKAFKAGSIGPTSPGVEMKIVDDEGVELEDGKEGEIIIKGGMVSPGYWNNEESTKEVFKEGWLYTGDLGYKDEDGFFFITDRKKDLIVRSGFNVSPREVEEVIMSNPKVEEAAVIGVLDKRERETVKAFVVLKEGEEMQTKEVLDYCSENLADYKIPKFIEFRDSLPKSATGKVLRKELRDTKKTDDRMILKEGENGG